MPKFLVIVESPAKAKTINKYLGKDYIVKSSIGHIRDLPVSSNSKKITIDPTLPTEEKNRLRIVHRMGINPEKNWEATYEILPGKEKVVSELKTLAKKSEIIFLATDLDREGEAIAWHLMESIEQNKTKYKRVIFNEITKSSIQKAFENPLELDLNRVNAQQTRRFLDRVVGFELSPLLWAKIARGLSAGRVQSVAVRLVVERDIEIRNFKPEEYWDIKVPLKKDEDKTYTFDVTHHKNKKFSPKSEEEVKEHISNLKKEDFLISAKKEKDVKSNPSPPFITSTLQQASSARLGFSIKKTMMLSQKLYESGLITYMRTDSLNLSQESIDMCRTYIQETLSEKYLPKKPNVYKSKNSAQEAHEAIRPSNVSVTASTLSLEPDALRLYELIWKQFVACQMSPAEYLSSNIDVSAGNYLLKIKGRVLKFDGFLRIHPSTTSSEGDVILPNFDEGDQLYPQDYLPTQHFTRPPPRYTEPLLVKELEKRNIGRPSTYASIISTIQDRGYVTIDKKRLFSEKIGEIVTQRLIENFTQLMDYNFTAELEERLDHIAIGKVDWLSVLDEFYSEFQDKLSIAQGTQNPDRSMRSNTPITIDFPCSQCNLPLQIKHASTGVFLSCSGYNTKPTKERCKQTVNLIPCEPPPTDDLTALQESTNCQTCKGIMKPFLINAQNRILICSNTPDCSGHLIEAGEFSLPGYDGPSLECDKCSQDMELKLGRFGKYFACTNDACTNTRKLLKSGEAAPPKVDPLPMPTLACQKVDDYYVLRDGASGIFLAASKFPKHRETRSPSIQELKAYAEQLNPKFHYFLKAPEFDPDGNPSIVRYSRKRKEQYLTSLVQGKPTKWRCYFKDNSWKTE